MNTVETIQIRQDIFKLKIQINKKEKTASIESLSFHELPKFTSGFHHPLKSQLFLTLYDYLFPNYDIVIPSFILYEDQKYNITRIMKNCFAEVQCEHIEFEEDSMIETIESGAFPNVESIILPSSVIRLEDNWLTSNRLKQVKVDEKNPFYKSYNDQFILKKSSPEKEKYDVLVLSVKTLDEVIIPDFIEIICSNAFCDSNKLKNVKIPENSKLRIIGEYAFHQCKELQTISIPSDSKLEIIRKCAFARTSINNIKIPSSLIQICAGAFIECRQLKTIEIPDDSNIKIIESYAFYDTKFISFKLPPHLNILNSNIFPYFLNLEIPSNSELKVIDQNYYSTFKGESFVIPSGVVEIFDGFWSRLLYEKVTVMPNNQYFKSLNDNIILGKSSFKKGIFDTLLYTCKCTETFTIPDEIEIIKKYAFLYKKKLKAIEFSENSKLKIIEGSVFQFAALKKINFPSSLVKIGIEAFHKCSKLRHIEFPENSELQKIDYSAFKKTAIEKLTIPASLEEIGPSSFSNCKKLRIVDIPKNSKLQKISYNAFKKSSIESFYIQPCVKIIEEDAFSFCANLQIIEIDENSQIENISCSMFENVSDNFVVMISYEKSIKIKINWPIKEDD